jgi:hypothetical protein
LRRMGRVLHDVLTATEQAGGAACSVAVAVSL